MKSNFVLLILISFLAPSCTSIYSSVQNSSSQPTRSGSSSKIVYLVDRVNSGNYDPIEMDEENEPEPIQGKDQWTRDFFGSLKYPATARENGIEGVVILDIEIDQEGKVIDVRIQQSVSRECDNAAREAFIYATQQGYYPLIIDNLPTKFRMKLPVNFWLTR